MILYFNTKIVNNTVYENNPFSYYPVFFPKNFLIENRYNFNLDILKITLKSYSKINFESCYFNIELESEADKYDIEKLIFKSYSKENVKELNFKRPSTLVEWKESIKILSQYSNKPIFTVFNHDHPFIDYQLSTFKDVINNLFNEKDSNFKKIFFYSHTPEFISLALNGNSYYGKKFKETKNGLYKVKVNRTIDSFAVMTFETLDYIFNGVIKYPEYIGRIDWKGLYFKKLKLKGYIYLREFFCHYEGYSHVTGIKAKNYLINKNFSNSSIEEKINFYYEKWFNISFLFLRDSLTVFYKRENYLRSLKRSIDFFYKNYILKDIENRILKEEVSKMILENLKNKIYYNSNELYIKLKTDKELNPRIGLISHLKDLIKTLFLYRVLIKFSK